MESKIDATKVVDLTKSTLVLNLELGRVSNRSKVASTTDAIDAKEVDRKMLHISVDLFDAPELKKCLGFLNSVRARVRSFTIPSPDLRGGMYFVKAEAVDDLDAYLYKALEEFKPMVKAFANVIDDRKAEAKKRLGDDVYSSLRYPSREEVLAVFRIEWGWLTLSAPGEGVKGISREFIQREQEKAKEGMKNIVSNAQAALAAQLKTISEHLIERLSPGADGKQKIFRNSAVDNINEYLATFELRSIGNSEELNAEVERVRALLKGVSPDSLRDNDKLREDITRGFKEVATKLDTLAIPKPVRFIEME
jgi:hypothetical protein